MSFTSAPLAVQRSCLCFYLKIFMFIVLLSTFLPLSVSAVFAYLFFFDDISMYFCVIRHLVQKTVLKFQLCLTVYIFPIYNILHFCPSTSLYLFGQWFAQGIYLPVRR